MARRLEALAERRTDAGITHAKMANEVYRRLTESESVKYAVGAMQPIDPEYTKNTFMQGERVRNQLEDRLATGCEYEYQGSVTNDTHIRARSDIDLLAIIERFWTLQSPQVPANPYKGDPVSDLVALRKEVITALTAAFPEATLDATGAKAVSLEGGSLRRKIDVVPSNWYDSNEYAQTGNKVLRGVQILDSKRRERLLNTPFLHNAWIEHKDSSTGGGLRKAARLMKSLKYDSKDVDLSSYDIVSIAFNMPDRDLVVPAGGDLLILDSCIRFCEQLQNSQTLREALDVPDRHRKVFAPGHASVIGLNALTRELKTLQSDILVENQRSFKRLAEARVGY